MEKGQNICIFFEVFLFKSQPIISSPIFNSFMLIVSFVDNDICAKDGKHSKPDFFLIQHEWYVFQISSALLFFFNFFVCVVLLKFKIASESSQINSP